MVSVANALQRNAQALARRGLNVNVPKLCPVLFEPVCSHGCEI